MYAGCLHHIPDRRCWGWVNSVLCLIGTHIQAPGSMTSSVARKPSCMVLAAHSLFSTKSDFVFVGRTLVADYTSVVINMHLT